MAESSDPLFAAWYARLREIAQSSLRRNGPQLTLSPTTLLHEVYMDLSKRDSLHSKHGFRASRQISHRFLEEA